MATTPTSGEGREADSPGSYPESHTVSYTVQAGDNLTRIAKKFAADFDTEWEDLADKIFQRNRAMFGAGKDDIQAGKVLMIPQVPPNPSSLSMKGRKEAATVSEEKPLLIGSIIHLENGLTHGGYLDARGWVTDKSVISNFQDERIRKFVSTHERPDRSVGSGSWLVLSADGKPDGAPLTIGDKVHLLNLNPGSGYLDTFEWVHLLVPFKDYPMQIGVFATSTPRRDGGVTGTWTIHSANGKHQHQPLVAGDVIKLENDFPNAGFLHTYGEVTQHPLFTEFDGQRLFVLRLLPQRRIQ